MSRSEMHQGRGDYVLLGYFSALLIFGLIMLTSAGAIGGYFKQQTFYFVSRQVLFGVLPGLVAFFICAKIPYQILKKYSLIIFFATLVLLLLVFIPGIGTTNNTIARNWIVIAGHSFQPAEAAKLGLIIFLAAYLSVREKELVTLTPGFLSALAIGMLPTGLVLLQPDVGSGAILSVIVFGLLFVAGARFKHLAGLAAAGLTALLLVSVFVPHIHERVVTFVHLWTGQETDISSTGYQVYHSLLAVGSGGLWGQGYGHSRQKFGYLPEVQADSIFAIIAEEMGFVFAAGVIVLLLLIAGRAMKIAKHAPDQFSRFLVAGIVVWFLCQSFLNIGTVIGVFPVTGVPLPFISHGGTALMMAMAAVGILMNVSRHSVYRP